MISTIDLVNLDRDTTLDIQNLIDSLQISEELHFVRGIYNIRNIFFKSNTLVTFEEGVIFNVLNKDENFKIIDTRVAGINMKFYAGVFNIIDQTNITLKGHCIINGNGSYFWEKYWGRDTKGGMREEYDKMNMRAFCDYDCMRVRNVLIQNSNNISITSLESKDSGFWNIHVLYSKNVVLDNIYVNSYSPVSPSTDGIDIDSSNNVVIKNCILKTNDDSISIKSGRDKDGIDTNIASYDIKIYNNTLYNGFGITIGSEVSGGVYNINIENNKFFNTDCGFRIKSSEKRKGYIKDINFINNYLDNVKYPIHIASSWNKSYNNLVIPRNYQGKIYEHYLTLCKSVENIGNTKISNIKIRNMNAINATRAFNIEWFLDSLIEKFEITDSKIEALEFGTISSVLDLKFINVYVSAKNINNNENDDYDNR